MTHVNNRIQPLHRKWPVTSLSEKIIQFYYSSCILIKTIRLQQFIALFHFSLLLNNYWVRIPQPFAITYLRNQALINDLLAAKAGGSGTLLLSTCPHFFCKWFPCIIFVKLLFYVRGIINYTSSNNYFSR